MDPLYRVAGIGVRTICASAAARATPPPTPEETEAPVKTAKELMEEAYKLHCDKSGNMSPDERTKAWFEVVARVTPRKDYANLPAEIWEKVLAELSSDLPF